MGALGRLDNQTLVWLHLMDFSTFHLSKYKNSAVTEHTTSTDKSAISCNIITEPSQHFEFSYLPAVPSACSNLLGKHFSCDCLLVRQQQATICPLSFHAKLTGLLDSMNLHTLFGMP